MLAESGLDGGVIENHARPGGAAIRCMRCPHVEHAAFDDCTTREERGERLLVLIARLHRHERAHDGDNAERHPKC